MIRPATTASDIAADPRVDFLVALGRALHAAGHHSQSIEDRLDEIALGLGVLDAQFFTTPTTIFAAFGSETRQRTFLIRVDPSVPNLGRLVRIEEVLDAVLSGGMEPSEGAARLRDVAVAGSPYGPMVGIVAYALSSGASAVFLGGGLREVGLAGALGLVTGLLALVTSRLPTLARIFPAAAAFAVAFLATQAGAWLGGVSVSTATLAGLVVLLPGMMIVSAMNELATGHLASGTARAAGAFIVLIGIGFGVAFGTRVAELVAFVPPHTTATPLPDWSTWVAVVFSALGFTVLLCADAYDAPWIVLGAMVALLAARLGTHTIGPELAPFVGSFAAAVAAWAFNRLSGRPGMVVLVPGVLVLVPGSIGYRSVTALFEHQIVSGIDAAVTAFLTAIALVAGILIAAVILPERRRS